MATEKIGPIANRVLMNLLDKSFKNGSITAKEYRDLKKEYFGKPKIIQMDLFPDDPKKKQKGGLMEQTNGLKKMGLRKGGKIKKRDPDRSRGKRPGSKKTMTPQERKELMDKIKKSQGKMTNPFLKFNKLGQPYMEAKDGGLAAATAKLKAQGLKKGGFPDLSGDGKVTMKDILMGRGVIKKPKKKQKGGSMDARSTYLKARNRKPSGRLTDEDRKRAKGAMKGVAKIVGKTALAPVAALTRAAKKAGRLAKRGYGIARK